jgi:ribosomal protein S18 acetylase RimI-like enzyme
VRESNAVAQRLYATLGFLQNGFRPDTIPITGEGALILWNNIYKKQSTGRAGTHETV